MRVRDSDYLPRDVFDVKFDTETWTAITKWADKKKITLSWTVRFCLFRFCRQHREWTAELMMANEAMKERYKKKNMSSHRHALCLYGDDALLLRIIAARLGITVSRLVRLAVEFHLEELETEKGMDLVHAGTKWIHSVELSSLDMDFRIQRLKLKVFQKENYWPFSPNRPQIYRKSNLPRLGH